MLQVLYVLHVLQVLQVESGWLASTQWPWHGQSHHSHNQFRVSFDKESIPKLEQCYNAMRTFSMQFTKQDNNARQPNAYPSGPQRPLQEHFLESIYGTLERAASG